MFKVIFRILVVLIALNPLRVEAISVAVGGKASHFIDKSGAATLTLPVRLTAPATASTVVTLTASGTAVVDNDAMSGYKGMGHDVTLTPNSFTFSAGEQTKNITVTVQNPTSNGDKVLKGDRSLTITLSSEDVTVSSANKYFVKIKDNNIPSTAGHRNIINVKSPNIDFDTGVAYARGLTALAGDTNDRARLQAIVTWLHDNNAGGIVYFPAGTYYFDTTSCHLWENITFLGEDKTTTILKKEDNYDLSGGAWPFTTSTNYVGDISADTKPIGFKNLTFHGNKSGNTGPEMVTNGTFDSDTGWTATGWTIENGYARHNTGNTNALSQAVSPTNGYYYVVYFTVSDMTAGSVTVNMGSAASSATVVTNGNFLYMPLAAAGVGPLTFTPSSDFNGKIDNVTCKRRGLDQRHFIQLSTGSTDGSHLVCRMEDCHFIEGWGDGVGLAKNVRFYGKNLTHVDSGRATIGMLGGNTKAWVFDLTATNTDPLWDNAGGFEAEVLTDGYDIGGNGARYYYVYLDGVTQGRLEITGREETNEESTSIVKNSTFTKGYLFGCESPNGSFTFDNCSFYSGYDANNTNYPFRGIIGSGSAAPITVTDSEFIFSYYTGVGTEHPPVTYFKWEKIVSGRVTGGRITLQNCSFTQSVTPTTTGITSALAGYRTYRSDDNKVVLDNCTFGSGLDYVLKCAESGVYAEIKNCVDIGAKGLLYLGAYQPDGRTFDVTLTDNSLSAACTAYAYIATGSGVNYADNKIIDSTTESGAVSNLTISAGNSLSDVTLTGGKTINGTVGDPNAANIHGFIDDLYKNDGSTWKCITSPGYTLRGTGEVEATWELQ